MWLTNLADVLRSGGLTVVEVDGWKTRGYLGQQMTAVRSIICHWTATNPAAKGDYPTLGTILSGNASTPGPLSQLGLGRNGTWYVCAAGLCNHAGVVDTDAHSNPRAIGIEAEYHPDQGAWPDVQQRSYERGCAVLSRHYGVPVSEIRGHYEVARPVGRKTDPNTLPGGMSGFRERVAALLSNNLEDDMQLAELIDFRPDLGGAPRNLWDGLAQVLVVLNAQTAALEALAGGKDVNAAIEAAVKKYTPTAEQNAKAQEATLVPVVDAALRRVQDADNIDEAKQTVAELLRQIGSLVPTKEVQQ